MRTYSAIACYIDCDILELRGHLAKIEELVERRIIAEDERGKKKMSQPK